jgi:curved DNA-binding protein CbpA
MKGTLAPGILPRVLRDLYTGRRTGLLHVSLGEERRSVRFRKGHIVRAETNVASERLGETLVRQGELSQEDLARATEVVIRDKKKLGAALQELGIMTRERLDDALAVHVREMLRSMFGWTEGEYEFEEQQSEAPVEGDISPRLPTGEMILEAVAAIGDAEIVRRELGELDRVLTPSLDPMLRFQKITLTPADGFLLSRVDGALSAREVLDLAPMEREEAERSLFGLICTGIVEWGEHAQRKVLPDLDRGRPAEPRAAAGPAGRAAGAGRDPASVRRELGDLERLLTPAGDPASHFQGMSPADGFLLSRVDGTLSAREVLDLAPMEREEAERGLLGLISNGVVTWGARAERKALPGLGRRARSESAPVATPASADPPPPARAPPEPAGPLPAPPDPSFEEQRAKRRQEIEDLHARLKTMNHFEALGIPRSSSEKEVKAAYFSLARRFHPDTHTDPGIADLEDKIEAIFIRVGAAYEVLRNRDKRTDYESSLPRMRPAAAPVAAAASTPAQAAAPEPTPAEDPMQVAARISLVFKIAAKHYQDQQYYDAIKLLESHLESALGPIRHRMRLLLAASRAKNPAWAKDAEDDIKTVLREDPKNVPAYLQLAQLYKEQNLKSRAASMFRKVLELDPESEIARAELGPAPQQANKESGGLLKKLFGRS